MRVSQSRRQVLWAVGFAGLGVCGARRSTREVRKLGHAREWWSCGRFVFVDEAAEDFAFVDGDRGCADEHGRGLVWRLKRERAVRVGCTNTISLQIERIQLQDRVYAPDALFETTSTS